MVVVDAPPFPQAAGGGYVAVVWWLLAALALASALTTAYCLVRGPRRGRTAVLGAALLVLAGVGALVLYTPAAATVDPTVEGGPAECPFDSVQGARLLVDHTSRIYTFWQPCETASRVRIGAVVGGYALLAGATGTWLLRGSRRARTAVPRAGTRAERVGS